MEGGGSGEGGGGGAGGGSGGEELFSSKQSVMLSQMRWTDHALSSDDGDPLAAERSQGSKGSGSSTPRPTTPRTRTSSVGRMLVRSISAPPGRMRARLSDGAKVVSGRLRRVASFRKRAPDKRRAAPPPASVDDDDDEMGT